MVRATAFRVLKTPGRKERASCGRGVSGWLVDDWDHRTLTSLLLYHHFVSSTKSCEPWLTEYSAGAVYRYTMRLAREIGFVVLALGWNPTTRTSCCEAGRTFAAAGGLRCGNGDALA